MSHSSRPEIVAIYCPLWHSYDHASSWKGEGWCEWELLKTAVPRFEGHYQPYKPTWGHFDESDPKWSAKEITLAADSGIDVFLVDWYWYSGVRIMEEALERGLLKAGNRKRIKFALMWANHDWADYFPAPFGQKWNSWLPSRHTRTDWERLMDYCIGNYFSEPNYWIVDNRLFFSVFQPLRLVRELGGISSFRNILEATQRRLAAAKLPSLHLNAMNRSEKDVGELEAAGFSSTTMYGVTSGTQVSANLKVEYGDVIEKHSERWNGMAETSLPHIPVVTMGWDVTPRCEKTVPWPFPPSPSSGKRDYPYGPVVVGNTPELFAELCRRGLEHAGSSGTKPHAVLINAWNEWTEGSFLLPEKRYGSAYLDAVRDTFGTGKANQVHSGGVSQ